MTSTSASTGPTDADSLPFPLPRPEGRPFDPPSEFLRFQHERPAAKIRLWSGDDAWLFTRYDDVRQVLSNPALSSDARHPKFPHESPGLVAHRKHQRMLITMDPPEHTQLRRVLARNFVVRELEKLRPNIQRISDDLVDEMAAMEQPVDFVAAFALPLPALAISGFLGVPPEDRHLFASLVERIADMSATHDESLAANNEFADYIRKLLDTKDAEPGEDVISRLLEEHKSEGTLTREDVVANVRLILVAAFETTANQIALGTMLLLLHDDQRALLAADPSLVNQAVEEILRYMTIDQFGRRRVAIADTEIGGELVREGEGVVVSQSAANRDDSVFPDGDKFDITRDARAHLSFSYGPHQCLGQAFARMELQVAFRTIIERLPTLRLAAPIEEIRFQDGQAIYGVEALPVAWDPDTIRPKKTVDED